MSANLHKAERALDEIIYHADQNAAAHDPDGTWKAHARRCREARRLIIEAGGSAQQSASETKNGT